MVDARSRTAWAQHDPTLHVLPGAHAALVDRWLTTIIPSIGLVAISDPRGGLLVRIHPQTVPFPGHRVKLYRLGIGGLFYVWNCGKNLLGDKLYIRARNVLTHGVALPCFLLSRRRHESRWT